MRAATIRPFLSLHQSFVICFQRAGPVGEEEAGPLEPARADLQAMFQVAMVVLVRLGMDDHGVVHPGPGHAPQQVLGSGRLGGLIRPFRVVRESGVVPPGEAVQVRVHHRGTPVVGHCPDSAAIRNWNEVHAEALSPADERRLDAVLDRIAQVDADMPVWIWPDDRPPVEVEAPSLHHWLAHWSWDRACYAAAPAV